MKSLDYAVGDLIRIFDGSSWGPGSFSTGRVKAISPSGQISVDQSGVVRRFMPSGKEVGGSVSKWRGGPWIEPKEDAEKRADEIRKYNARENLKRKVRTELETLSKFDPTEERELLISRLRVLADELAKIGDAS